MKRSVDGRLQHEWGKDGSSVSNIFGKKQVLLATLILALGVAVYLNYYFATKAPDTLDANGGVSTSDTSKNLGDAQFVGNNSTVSGDEQANTTPDYFAQARANRETAREEALDLIKDMMNDAKATDAIKQEALAKTEAVAAAIEQESKIESLVKAKGFEDCVVFIEDKTCHIVVKAEGLQPQEAAQITDIICAQSQVPATGITIVTSKG